MEVMKTATTGFEGRADDVVKSSGLPNRSVRGGECSDDSSRCCGMCNHRCVPDDIRGMVVKATIILGKEWKEKAGPELIKELQDHVKNTTAPTNIRVYPEFVDELPKTISGKIRRVEIREKIITNKPTGEQGLSKFFLYRPYHPNKLRIMDKERQQSKKE